MINWASLSSQLKQDFDLDIRIQSASPVAGGDIHRAYKLHTDQGNFFLKTNNLSAVPLFETEARSLQKLAESNSITVPKAMASGSTDDQAWLLLNFLEMSSQGSDAQRGKDLALLHHQINPQKQFGWFEDNYIGHTLQKNDWDADWLRFYGDKRLKFQLDLARENGATHHLYDQGLKLIEELPKFFEHYQPEASPLHGDLWGGNSAFLTSGEAVFFDPASYYGDREADLAMTELFGGFSKAFYQGYDDVFPLDSGYQQRKTLYNLYHILNHYNLFGGGYANQALRMIEQLL